MVVEELLQLLVDKVDGDLLKAVVLQALQAGNVERSAEVCLLRGDNDLQLDKLDLDDFSSSSSSPAGSSLAREAYLESRVALWP